MFESLTDNVSAGVLGLRDVQLSVPEAVGVGASATLGCRWALDTGETLYTVKWYHGAQEFFRFVPKELPNTRVFSQTGISVDVSVTKQLLEVTIIAECIVMATSGPVCGSTKRISLK